jgi:predicted nicotinamide N-methyase
MMEGGDLRAFGRPLQRRRPPLCPEIELWLLCAELDLEAECHELGECQPPPYWAFCWGSGQALARYLLDHPERVRGRDVVDFGTGCGIAAIAAARAGARSVVAVDHDPVARRAASRNARHNAVELDFAAELPEHWDVLLASDVLYEVSNQDWLLEFAGAGRDVILSDPERPSSPAVPATATARFDVCTLPDVDPPVRSAAVFLL